MLIQFILGLFALVTFFTHQSSAIGWEGQPGKHLRPKKSRCYHEYATNLDSPYWPASYKVTVELQGPAWKEVCNKKNLMLPRIAKFIESMNAQGGKTRISMDHGQTFRTRWDRTYCTVILEAETHDWILGFFSCIAPAGAELPEYCIEVSQLPFRRQVLMLMLHRDID